MAGGDAGGASQRRLDEGDVSVSPFLVDGRTVGSSVVWTEGLRSESLLGRERQDQRTSIGRAEMRVGRIKGRLDDGDVSVSRFLREGRTVGSSVVRTSALADGSANAVMGVSRTVSS